MKKSSKTIIYKRFDKTHSEQFKNFSGTLIKLEIRSFIPYSINFTTQNSDLNSFDNNTNMKDKNYY